MSKNYLDSASNATPLIAKPVVASRPLGLPFRPSLTNYTLLSYTATLQVNAGADDAGIFLISDETNNPSVVRAKASLFNTAIGAGAAYSSARTPVMYIVPPKHYVKVQQNVVGTALAGVEFFTEQELQLGVRPIVVNTDGPTGVYVPESVPEFGAIGLDAPDAIWLKQDPATHAVDEMGFNLLSASGTVSYANRLAQWSRSFLGTSQGVAGAFSSSSSTLPNPASASMGVFALVQLDRPTATRSVMEFFANDMRARVTTAGALELLVDGGGTQAGTVDYTTLGVFPLYMQYNFTGSTIKIYTHREIITAAYAVGASRNVFFGSAAAAPSAKFGHAFAYYGSKAEKTDAQVRAMFTNLRWPVAW